MHGQNNIKFGVRYNAKTSERLRFQLTSPLGLEK